MNSHGHTYCIQAHLLDSLLLSKLLDQLQDLEIKYRLEHWQIGHSRKEPSRICLRTWPTGKQQTSLESLMESFGAVSGEPKIAEALVAPSPQDGVFPSDFMTTTNEQTDVFYQNQWLPIAHLCMDTCIKVNDQGAEAVKFSEVQKGDLIVVGKQGIRIHLSSAVHSQTSEHGFRFMTSHVSTEKPWQQKIQTLAGQLKAIKGKKKVLLVGGPAIIHTGAARDLEALIEGGWITLLYAGNALATHDIEAAFYGSSLGVDQTTGDYQEEGERHHLWAINRIRQAGGIQQAVQAGMLTQGIMHACITHHIDFILAGSIRDDGPLPEVITDAIEAQKAMKARLPEVGLVIMLATLLHSVAVGNLLPANIPTYMVDIHSMAATKLSDRGSAQAQALVMDAKSFLHELRLELES